MIETFLRCHAAYASPRVRQEDFSLATSRIADSRDVEEHSPETLSFSFSTDVIKKNQSVSIILELPTLHPIQTIHLFPL